MAVTILPEAPTTLANLKESLSITDTSSDNRLTNIINRITIWLETQTNRKLKARNYNGYGTAFSTTALALGQSTGSILAGNSQSINVLSPAFQVKTTQAWLYGINMGIDIRY